MNTEIFKFNTIELAKNHKKKCDNKNCVISLNVLMEMAEKAGVKFTDKEKQVFI